MSEFKAPDMKAIRAHLLADEEAKKSRQNSGDRPKTQRTGDNASFAFWNVPVGGTATIRLTPDQNENNILPWVERQTIALTFDGVVGGEMPTSKPVSITVPCVDMFRKETNMVFADLEFTTPCPIIAHTRSWWAKKGEPETAQSALARKYYKKRSWIMQGFAVKVVDESGKEISIEDEKPENPLRRFTVGKKLYDKVYKGFYGTEFEYAPNDFVNGCDFNIVKSLLGDNNNYDQSGWARRERSLSADEMGAIEQFGLYDLKDYLGKVPTKEGVEVIYAMFLDSLAGKPFDFDSYGEFYRPYGVRGGDSAGSTRSETAAQTPARDEPAYNPAPAAADEQGGAPKFSATDDLIARIRNRSTT